MIAKLTKRIRAHSQQAPTGGNGSPLILPEGILPSASRSGGLTPSPGIWAERGAFAWTAVRLAASLVWEGICYTASLLVFLVLRKRHQGRLDQIILKKNAGLPAEAAGRKVLVLLFLSLGWVATGPVGCKAFQELGWTTYQLSGVDELKHPVRELQYDFEIFSDPELKNPGLVETFTMIGWY
ncbi:MAG: hypothetical protein HY717_00225 [Planctomycetes bacterium]|nr:hypothetical protein [Planctomycetota bacterium]